VLLRRTWLRPEFYGVYLHVGVEKLLIVLSFVDHLFVLELVSCVHGVLPMVLMAPETIMSEMMIALKLEVISLIN